MTVTRAKSAWGLLACLAVACALAACTGKDVTEQVTSAIQQAVTAASPGSNRAVSEDVQRFYAARSFAPAWAMDKEQAAAALRLLQQAPAHGLPAEVYLNADLPGLLAPEKKSIEES